jgi:hypothetical protein
MEIINNSDFSTGRPLKKILKFPIIFPKGIDKNQKVV